MGKFLVTETALHSLFSPPNLKVRSNDEKTPSSNDLDLSQLLEHARAMIWIAQSPHPARSSSVFERATRQSSADAMFSETQPSKLGSFECSRPFQAPTGKENLIRLRLFLLCCLVLYFVAFVCPFRLINYPNCIINGLNRLLIRFLSN